MDGADMMKTRYTDWRVKSRIVWACSEFPGISGSSHGRIDTFILWFAWSFAYMETIMATHFVELIFAGEIVNWDVANATFCWDCSCAVGTWQAQKVQSLKLHSLQFCGFSPKMSTGFQKLTITDRQQGMFDSQEEWDSPCGLRAGFSWQCGLYIPKLRTSPQLATKECILNASHTKLRVRQRHHFTWQKHFFGPVCFTRRLHMFLDFNWGCNRLPWSCRHGPESFPEITGEVADHQLFAVRGRRSKEDETKGGESSWMAVRCKLLGVFWCVHDIPTRIEDIERDHRGRGWR